MYRWLTSVGVMGVDVALSIEKDMIMKIKKKELFFNLKENNYVEMIKTIHTHFIILWTVQKVCTYFMRYDMKRKVHTISPGIAGSQITFSLKLERKLLIENNERIDEDSHNLLVASHKYWQTTV